MTCLAIIQLFGGEQNSKPWILPEEDEGDLFENINEENQIEPFMAAAAVMNLNIDHHSIGDRINDRSFDWWEESQNYPRLEEVENFLKTFKQFRQTTDHASSSSEVILSKEQQDIINLCPNQIEIIKTGRGDIPKRVVIQGKADCGKSFLIKEMVRSVNLELGENCIKLAAPTGAAALNIEGKTIHSLFRLNLNTNKYEPLNGGAKKKWSVSS